MQLKYAPHTLIVDQTVLCNQACGFCWRADVDAVRSATKAAPVKTMPFGMYQRIIDMCAPVPSLRRLSLCGPMGEPTLVSDLAKRGLYAKKSKRFSEYIIINTNGFALDKHDPVELLAAFTAIHISLDAIDFAIHERIHGKAGQLHTILKNIDCLVRTKRNIGGGAEIKVRFTECAENVGHWPAFSKYFSGQVDSLIHKRAHSFIDVLPEHGSHAGAVLCNQPYGNINFTFDGRVTTCCINHKMSPTFGHVDDGRSIREIWESSEFEAWRRSRHDGICNGCSGLGSQSQRPDGQIAQRDLDRLAQISKIGEEAFYR